MPHVASPNHGNQRLGAECSNLARGGELFALFHVMRALLACLHMNTKHRCISYATRGFKSSGHKLSSRTTKRFSAIHTLSTTPRFERIGVPCITPARSALVNPRKQTFDIIFHRFSFHLGGLCGQCGRPVGSTTSALQQKQMKQSVHTQKHFWVKSNIAEEHGKESFHRFAPSWILRPSRKYNLLGNRLASIP